MLPHFCLGLKFYQFFLMVSSTFVCLKPRLLNEKAIWLAYLFQIGWQKNTRHTFCLSYTIYTGKHPFGKCSFWTSSLYKTCFILDFRLENPVIFRLLSVFWTFFFGVDPNLRFFWSIADLTKKKWYIKKIWFDCDKLQIVNCKSNINIINWILLANLI